MGILYQPVGTSGGNGAYDYTNLTAVTINSDQNNYPLPALPSSGLRISGTSNFDITGLSGGVNNKFVLIFNVTTNKKIKLKHNDAASSVGNRFFMTDQSDMTILVYGSALLRYDSTIQGYHIINVMRH